VSFLAATAPRAVEARLFLIALAFVSCARPKGAHVGAVRATPASPVAEAIFDASTANSPVDAAPPPRAARDGVFANMDPSDDTVVGPPDALPDCEDQLVRAGVTFRAATLPVHTQSKIVCGASQVVTYLHGPGGIAYDPSPLLTCAMALAMSSFERIMQEEAARIFRSPVARIEQLGTYNCRGIAAYKGIVSEHSYANAIDLARFTLKSGTSFSVLSDFDAGEGPPARPAGAFLRVISLRGFDEDVFSNVLTPFWNASHKNHFHLDLARYRVNGVRARDL
jgi:hypothetical protein